MILYRFLHQQYQSMTSKFLNENYIQISRVFYQKGGPKWCTDTLHLYRINTSATKNYPYQCSLTANSARTYCSCWDLILFFSFYSVLTFQIRIPILSIYPHRTFVNSPEGVCLIAITHGHFQGLTDAVFPMGTVPDQKVWLGSIA